MIGKHDRFREQLGQLGSALARDVDELSDKAVLREAEQRFGDPEKAAAEMRCLIDAAVAAHGKRRLAAARQGYGSLAGKARLKIVALPLDKKRALLERFARDDRAFREKLTMAARNEEDHGADLDSFLKDLVELGVVDEEGNVL